MSKKNTTSSLAAPYGVRFTEKQSDEIDKVSEQLSMSRQEVIRLATEAGLLALNELGRDGLTKRIAEMITKS